MLNVEQKCIPQKIVLKHAEDSFLEKGNNKKSVLRWEKSESLKIRGSPWKEGIVRLEVYKVCLSVRVCMCVRVCVREKERVFEWVREWDCIK